MNCCWPIRTVIPAFGKFSSMIGGPLLYLAGVILFKRSIRGHLQPSHLAGIGLFVILDAVRRTC